jgi:hypothetical protein
MLDLPDNKSRATGTNGTTSGTIFSFPVSPGEEEIEAEGLDELDVKSEIDYQIGEEGKGAFCLSLCCFCCPSHPLFPSLGHLTQLTGYRLFHWQGARVSGDEQ